MSLQKAQILLRFCPLLFCLPSEGGVAIESLASPVVWSGLTFEFVKPDFTFPFPADQITHNVWLTWGLFPGPYNALLEDRGDVTSPLGTRWTTDLNNPGATITSANHAALEFDSWLNAYGGPTNAGRNVVGRDAVLHLITDDIYLDIRFTAWSQGGSGGGFAYLRAEPREIIPEQAVGSLLPVGLILLAAVTWWRTVYTKLYSAVVRGRTPLQTISKAVVA